MSKQPDLFSWQPPTGTPVAAIVIAFPLDRDIGRIRHVARLMLGKRSDKARAAYWRVNVCASLSTKLQSSGFSEAEVRRQLEAFSRAVGFEMDRLMNGTRERM